MHNKVDQPETQSTAALYLGHLALWFGPLFATPLFIATHNSADITISLGTLAGICAVFSIMLSGITFSLSTWTGRVWHKRISIAFLAMAFVLAIQGNLIHDLFYYGDFNGSPVNFRDNGWQFHAEWIGFLLAIPLVSWVLARIRQIPVWIPMLPIVSSLLLVSPVLLTPVDGVSPNTDVDDVDSAVFQFSDTLNLIHLLPDGLQGDIVEEVLNEDSDLASHFKGFTLFANHVGRYQGTAPAVATLLTGEPFQFERGHDYAWVIPYLQENAYQNSLSEAGFRMDLVPATGLYCIGEADSCHPRSFNDMKARGYTRQEFGSALHSIYLVADLTLFRLFPMVVKEKIYDQGHWFLSDTNAHGTSPHPDPVIREWTSQMEVTSDRPVYKWYHYIGTHIPPHWDANCNYIRELAHERENYKQQTVCVLTGIADFLQKLKSANIYDQTAIVITGDHGINLPPSDQSQPSFNASLYAGMSGSARPAFLVKRRHQAGPLQVSEAPTALEDVAATVLELAGLDEENYGRSAFSLDDGEDRPRLFTPYSTSQLWGTNPVPHDVYEVKGNIRDGQNWVLKDILVYEPAPSSYPAVNYESARQFMRGASLNPNRPEEESSWISGHQVAFLVTPDPDVLRGMEMILTLHVPEWVGPQSFEVSVNDEQIGSTIEVPVLNDPFWKELVVPVPANTFREGNNIVSVVFDTVAQSPQSETFRASALLKSVHLRP